MTQDLAPLQTQIHVQARRIEELQQALGRLQDKDDIQQLQFMYGFFLDNRMFREIADLFTDQGAWMEIGGRGLYRGKERIHDFLLQVLGGGRWGLLPNEVINHVQQQFLITVDAQRQKAWARGRAQVQGNSPPDTPHLLLADGIYENEYVRENGRWKILGVRVAMTFYAAVERQKIWFAAGPPNEQFPPDEPSRPVEAGLGRQFARWHFKHPTTGKELPVPNASIDP